MHPLELHPMAPPTQSPAQSQVVMKHSTFGPAPYGSSVSLLRQVEVHLVIDVLPLGVELLKDLSEDVDCLLAAQSGAFGLELLQQVFSGHGLSDQIPSHGLLSQLHITERQTGRAERQEVSVMINS